METVRKVRELVDAGTVLRKLLDELGDIDTDSLCLACGYDALNLNEAIGLNQCANCGSNQKPEQVVALDDELWPHWKRPVL